LKQHSEVIPELLTEIDSFPLDRTSISQESLDLANKERTSLFPWRGQFSPQLVELLLSHYTRPDSVILDPFVGSGTTLFEAARFNLACFGVEINPAAFEMAKTAEFVNVEPAERNRYIARAKDLLKKYLPGDYDWKTLMSRKRPTIDRVKQMLRNSSKEPVIHNILTNVVMRHSLSKDGEANFSKSFDAHCRIIQSLPQSRGACKVFLDDARKLPLDPGSVDFVVTSPPYINVFNYHQYYRSVMELDGWDLLDVAKSEIGSNRRNRGNRFLTVIEYSIDMLSALQEIKRVLKPQGRAVIVVGRQSSIRGVQFENFKIISCLALGGAGLQLVNRQERRFVNRFGEHIVEDLLHFVHGKRPTRNAEGFGRIVGRFFLTQALAARPSEVITGEITDAIDRYQSVFPAPVFNGRGEGGTSARGP
jgi:SAM-dependent methyltransferase